MVKKSLKTVAQRNPLLYGYVAAYVILYVLALFINLYTDHRHKVVIHYSYRPAVLTMLVVVYVLYSAMLMYLIFTKYATRAFLIIKILLIFEIIGFISVFVHVRLVTFLISFTSLTITVVAFLRLQKLVKDPTYVRPPKKTRVKNKEWTLGI